MYTRYGILEGEFEAGQEEEVFRQVQERLVPLWQKMPHAMEVRVMRSADCDPGAPSIALMVEIDYPSLAAIEEAVNSQNRVEARTVSDDVFKAFKGRIYHLIQRREAIVTLG
ncbi:hypothetical protein G6L58_23500 [Agrobacterium tumefaciens]|nr:hypothetical protein [Agrobacterium tumefaciens]NSY93414.1 hypothetical protein [Agrobacterium tumefaciens]